MPNRGEVSPITPRDIALVQIEAELRHQDDLWGYEHDKHHTDADWLMLAMSRKWSGLTRLINGESIRTGTDAVRGIACGVEFSSGIGE